MNELRPTLRDMLDSGQATFGGWCILPSPLVVEVMGSAGFDWVSIDAQHGLIGRDGVVAALGALASTGTPGFVRVSSHDAAEVGKALDAGAQGVIVPMISTAEDARAAVRACRYAPEGARSWGPTRVELVRPGHTPEEANDLVVCVALVETWEGVQNIDEIVQVPGIDAVMIGPTDLAITMGLRPTTGGEYPEHDEAVARVLAACRARNMPAGIYCNGVEMAQLRLEQGFTLLAVVTDMTMLRTAAREAVEAMKAAAGLP